MAPVWVLGKMGCGGSIVWVGAAVWVFGKTGWSSICFPDAAMSSQLPPTRAPIWIYIVGEGIWRFSVSEVGV